MNFYFFNFSHGWDVRWFDTDEQAIQAAKEDINVESVERPAFNCLWKRE